jgi:hypothetical protein
MGLEKRTQNGHRLVDIFPHVIELHVMGALDYIEAALGVILGS